MGKKILKILMFSMVLIFSLLPSSKVYADELNCVVSVNVTDVLGEYNNDITICLQTENEEQKKEYANGVYGKKTFLTQDFGSATLEIEMGDSNWKLVDSTFSVPQPFETTRGTNINMELFLIPSENNEKYAEYLDLISNGTNVVSSVLNQLGMSSETTSVSDYGNGENFDFESWHTDAMKAYENYTTLLYSKADDSTWQKVFRNADITRAVSQKNYLNSVKNATTEEWNSFPQAEVIDYFTTYLTFVLLTNESKNYYDSQFNSGDVPYENYFKYQVGIDTWKGNGSEELIDAYMKVAEFQLQYYEYYSFPYNFHNDRSYAEEISLDIVEESEEITNDFSNEEIEEIKEVEEEFAESEKGVKEKSKDLWSEVLDKLKKVWFSLLMLALFTIGYVIVRKKIKDKNVDDMTESGK